MEEEDDGEVNVYDDEVLEVISLGENDGAIDENGILHKGCHNVDRILLYLHSIL